MKQTTPSLFVSMSFVTLLDYSVVNVRVVDHQSAVMKKAMALLSVEIMHHITVTQGLGSC